jgi:L-aminopeptidase/D-esterase-like protein
MSDEASGEEPTIKEQTAPMNAITDVGGIRVGHHHRLDPDVTLGNGWASGTTVVLTPPAWRPPMAS